jgi:hypothetical protein
VGVLYRNLKYLQGNIKGESLTLGFLILRMM